LGRSFRYYEVPIKYNFTIYSIINDVPLFVKSPKRLFLQNFETFIKIFCLEAHPPQEYLSLLAHFIHPTRFIGLFQQDFPKKFNIFRVKPLLQIV
jgi:hypothetical protein